MFSNLLIVFFLFIQLLLLVKFFDLFCFLRVFVKFNDSNNPKKFDNSHCTSCSP